MRKNILILGADGMVGRTVYRYLQTIYPQNVWGTTRRKKNDNKTLLHFTTESYKKNFSNIIKKLKKIDYIINCIAITKNDYQREKLIYTNALFPLLLEKFVEEQQCKLIHISTDGVFPLLAGEVYESSPPGPNDYYSNSKLLGETLSKNALTFRTSFLGLDSVSHKGLLEKIKRSNQSFNGYTNQIWTGCTTLQFAKLCEEIIKKNLFTKFRKASPILHFAPLGPLTKYEIVNTFTKLIKKSLIIKKTKGEERKRILRTDYIYLPFLNQYNNDIKKALQELINFES